MNKYECPKCSGKGNITAYANIAGGVCFACGGKGYKLQKSAPKVSRTYSFLFLWEDQSDPNYRGGEFCRCFNKKARSLAAAERIAAQAMARNGSVAFKIEAA